jgi:spore coat polysaccharide biosynthesis protein SpsF
VRTGIFIQVRLGSTRLPEKAVLPLGGATVIRHAMRALRGVPAEERALLTDRASAHALKKEAGAEGYSVFPGSDLDVLGRYCDACRRYSVTRVVRATGDNPLVSARLAREILRVHEERNADLSHYLGCPWGCGVEIVEADALFAAEAEAEDPAEREHITTFLYRHPDRFAIVEEEAPPETYAPEARVTVDTREDYERVQLIFSHLYQGAPIEAEALVSWFLGESGKGDG